jgi:hypothetical protein
MDAEFYLCAFESNIKVAKTGAINFIFPLNLYMRGFG